MKYNTALDCTGLHCYVIVLEECSGVKVYGEKENGEINYGMVCHAMPCHGWKKNLFVSWFLNGYSSLIQVINKKSIEIDRKSVV